MLMLISCVCALHVCCALARAQQVKKVRSYFLSAPAQLDAASGLPKAQFAAIKEFQATNALKLKKNMKKLTEEERSLTGGMYKIKEIKERIVVRSRAQLACEVSRVQKLFLLEVKGKELQGLLTDWEKNQEKYASRGSNACPQCPQPSPLSSLSPSLLSPAAQDAQEARE